MHAEIERFKCCRLWYANSRMSPVRHTYIPVCVCVCVCVCVSSLQASLLCCVAVVCLLGTASALAAGSTVVHVVVHAPPGFLRDKPEVFVRSGSRVQVVSNMQTNGLQVDRYGKLRCRLVDASACRRTECVPSLTFCIVNCIFTSGSGLQ